MYGVFFVEISYYHSLECNKNIIELSKNLLIKVWTFCVLCRYAPLVFYDYQQRIYGFCGHSEHDRFDKLPKCRPTKGRYLLENNSKNSIKPATTQGISLYNDGWTVIMVEVSISNHSMTLQKL